MSSSGSLSGAERIAAAAATEAQNALKPLSARVDTKQQQISDLFTQDALVSSLAAAQQQPVQIGRTDGVVADRQLRVVAGEGPRLLFTVKVDDENAPQKFAQDISIVG